MKIDLCVIVQQLLLLRLNPKQVGALCDSSPAFLSSLGKKDDIMKRECISPPEFF